MAECRIEVITYEQSRLEYFKELQNRQKKRFEKFKKSSAIKELPPQERYYQISKMGEVLQYYDDIVKMLEDCGTHTNDVVPVVRCKDCIHRDPEDKKCDCSFQARGGIFPMDDNDFCSYGEKVKI